MAQQRRTTIVETPGFIHFISSKEAEQLLLTKGFDGSFLVRTSTSDPRHYSLSFRDVNKVIHIKFETTEEGFTAKNLDDEYPTIGALITKVQTTQKGLDYPLWPSDPAPAGLEPRLFFGRLTSKHAEKLLLNPDCQPERNFLIRSSCSMRNQLVLSVRLGSRQIVHTVISYENGEYLMKSNSVSGKFSKIQELIDHYTKQGNTMVTMVDNENATIQLIKPMICPWNKDQSTVTDKSKASSLEYSQKTSEEFQVLQSEGCSGTDTRTSEIGKLPENIRKNRYKNILPYDDTRVILRPPPDYVNASYLTIIPELARYIACQGPLPHTVVDFWRMVWQEKCRFIVMLTNTVEGGKNKCTQYWPKDKGPGQPHENFQIQVKKTVSSTKDYVITMLGLLTEGTELDVYHCHYIAWPDKSVPKHVESLVTFSEEILDLRSRLSPLSDKDSPIVAHCSAGIGRTGTYILISLIIEHVRIYGTSPNVLEYSKKLRKQRPGMIQTQQQYEMVYKAKDIYASKSAEESSAHNYGNLGESRDVYDNIDSSLQRRK